MIEYFVMCRHWSDHVENIGLLAHDTQTNHFAMYIDSTVVAKQELNPILFGLSQDLAVTDKLIKLWIEARAIPRDRENIDAIMESYNIPEYSEWELLKTANGCNPGYDNWGFYPISENEIKPQWKDKLVWR